MLISCLMPTYNRYPSMGFLVEEAVESFIRQDHQDRELLICNDTPGQLLEVHHPKVKVFNLQERLPTLSDKLQFLIDHAQGEAFCRWDDDDISLPHRLSFSQRKLGDKLEWRAGNYWWDTGTLTEVAHAGNTHVQSIFRRSCLDVIGGKYPPKLSGYEDQAFNKALVQAGFPRLGEVVAPGEIYYLYRWATGSLHLSGVGGPPENLQAHYDTLGTRPIATGVYKVQPRWRTNHLARVGFATRDKATKTWEQIGGYFDFQTLYDVAIASAPRGSTLVEVGCLYGRSLSYLGTKAKAAHKRLRVIGVDFGLGVDPFNPSKALTNNQILIQNIQQAGLADVVTVIHGESTAVAELLADQSCFMVLLDDAHDYQAVKAGLQAWQPKVQSGGIFAGHDYIHQDYPGVAQAVDEYFDRPHLGTQSPHSETCWEVRC